MNSWDYFHVCNETMVSVPDNFAGHQWPATGDGCAGFIAWGPDPPNAPPYFPIEVIGGTLSTPLQVGVEYFVSFKVSLASAYLQCCFADYLGLLFTSTVYGDVGYPVTGRPPVVQDFAHVFDPSPMMDSTNWVTISGTYVADSAYTHFLIGRFFTAVPNTPPCWCLFGNRHAFYYLDDVYIAPLEEVSIAEAGLPGSYSPVISYSVLSDEVRLGSRTAGDQFSASIWTTMGTQAVAELAGSGTLSLSTRTLSSGAYILRIKPRNAAPRAFRIVLDQP